MARKCEWGDPLPDRPIPRPDQPILTPNAAAMMASSTKSWCGLICTSSFVILIFTRVPSFRVPAKAPTHPKEALINPDTMLQARPTRA